MLSRRIFRPQGLGVAHAARGVRTSAVVREPGPRDASEGHPAYLRLRRGFLELDSGSGLTREQVDQLALEARIQERMWDCAAPERHMEVSSPAFKNLLVAVVLLQTILVYQFDGEEEDDEVAVRLEPQRAQARRAPRTSDPLLSPPVPEDGYSFS
eukprot:CAMPEP_0204402876 /NCGR_PEP_ID=MMETSP0470-20130426/5544_1 /ASSEMBLY_ACC=CAM_ASM_000385 /TAXON_ID=2969 /ORGANISM="Oxyrrhis marina" /LENGTH=154 /DNA_ID=CAMNT_0051397973 /DNA_START=31 /DNA_END=495 /DNA_ORIENTATION=-